MILWLVSLEASFHDDFSALATFGLLSHMHKIVESGMRHVYCAVDENEPTAQNESSKFQRLQGTLPSQQLPPGDAK